MKLAVPIVVCALSPALFGCSLGQGTGFVKSDRMIAEDCWDGPYDLQPDFFAAIPFRNTLQIRVQRGSDLAEVSDGVDVLIDDIAQIRANPGKKFRVSLPPGLHAPGTPIVPPQTREPEIVHMSLYLQRSCHNENAILYSIGGHIAFESLFDGDPNEKDAVNKHTIASFEDVVVGDPRDAPPYHQASEIPLDRQTKLQGTFEFYFERGQPGQPFP